jgi:hypothetical protein
MWRSYGLAPEGVAIQSTVGSIKTCLNPHRCEAVKYYDPINDIKTKTFIGPSDILFKRERFSWEREFRIWFDDDELLNRIERGEEIEEARLSPGESKQISYMDEFVEKLVVAPGASDQFVDMVKELCGTRRMKWLATRVVRSCFDRSCGSFANS